MATGSRWRALTERLVAASMGPEIVTKRLVLRALRPSDFHAWQEIRRRCADWLLVWEPMRPPGAIDPTESRAAFESRCDQRDRERANGTGFGFAILEGGRLIGECNINNVQRGAMQGGYVGYWIDQAKAGNSFMSEAVVGVLGFAFEDLGLHRIQISIVPRNHRSRRVVEKLGLREEGIAERYLEINGVWEDHIRYAITSEEWQQRRVELRSAWLGPSGD